MLEAVYSAIDPLSDSATDRGNKDVPENLIAVRSIRNNRGSSRSYREKC